MHSCRDQVRWHLEDQISKPDADCKLKMNAMGLQYRSCRYNCLQQMLPCVQE